MKKIVRVYLSTYIDVDIDKCEDFENDEEMKGFVTGYLADFIDKDELDEHLCMEPTEVEVIDVNSEFDIEDYGCLDDMTWLCEFFAKEVHTATDDYQSKMVVEYHKDEDRWVVDEQFYDFDGEYIDHIILKDEALRDKYLGIAQKKYNEVITNKHF